MKNKLNEEQQEFINQLSRKMKTQDTRCTAQPYALVIRTEETVYGIDTDYTSNVALVFGDEVYRDFSVFVDFLEECEHESVLAQIKEFDVTNFHEFDARVDSDSYITGYKTAKTADSSNGLVSGNLFLTEDAAKDYIKANKHNLTNPDTYGIHLYRNPEMAKLYDVIHALAESND